MMFQSLKNRMDTMKEAINTINTINKDIGKTKNKHIEMNNTITNIKNTLEGTNSRITEAEDRLSEVEDIMVKINEAERKKELKEMRTTSETSGTMFNTPTFES